MNIATDQREIIDEIISEVRCHKHDIAMQFDFDVMALGRSLQERESADFRFKNQHKKDERKVKSAVE
jgi:hypothetical protein